MVVALLATGLLAGGMPAARARAHGLGVLGVGRLDDAGEELRVVFGPLDSFTASLRITTRYAGATASYVRDVAWARRGDAVRLDADLAQDTAVSADEVRSRRRHGTDRVLWIMRPDRHTRYQIYPRLHA